MNQFIHDLVSRIKFLYPCIAYEESTTDAEIVVKAETKLSKIYQIKMSVNGMKYIGEDFWGRPTFESENGQFYCEFEGELYFKGNDSEGEPNYPAKALIKYEFPNIDKELVEFQFCIDKVVKFASEHKDIELIDIQKQIDLKEDDILNSNIVCIYKFKVLNKTS